MALAVFALMISAAATWANARISFTKIETTFGFWLGIAVLFVTGAMVFASLLSIPLTFFVGIGGVVAYLQSGGMRMIYALVTCFVTAVNLWVWIKYLGLPLQTPGIHPLH